MSKIYNDLDLKEFKIGGKNNPYAAVDNDRQKISINPGVAYRSTSHNDVFELRNKLKYKKLLKSLNRFITTEEPDVYS